MQSCLYLSTIQFPNMVHRDKCFFPLLKEMSPIISFNWRQCVCVLCTPRTFCLLCSQGLGFSCESEYIFLSPSLLFWRILQIKTKDNYLEEQNCRFPRHWKLMCCWGQKIPRLRHHHPHPTTAPIHLPGTRELTFWLCLPFGWTAAVIQKGDSFENSPFVCKSKLILFNF